MPFPTTAIIDNFNRANEGPPMTGWTDNALGEGADNQLKVVSNACQAATLSTSCESYYNVATYSGNLEVYVTGTTKPGDSQRMEIGFLQSPGSAAADGYSTRFEDIAGAGNDTNAVYRIDNAASTQLGSTTTEEWSAADVLGLRKFGSELISWRNGVQKVSTSDATYTGTFNLYLCIRSTTGVADNFGGGRVVVRHLALLGAGT